MAKEIVKLRNKPILVLYYPDGYPDNYAEICDEKKIEQLDVLLHTDGGVPDSAYQIAQVIRNFSNNVTFLIPIKALSAGTLMCSCANEILLGDYGVLSSIDISTDEGETELINIHYFMKFAVDCREMTEKMFESRK